MKPVNQLYHDGTHKMKGDCLRGALASILEKRIDDVPHFIQFFDSKFTWRAFNLYLEQFGKTGNFVMNVDDHKRNKYYIAAYTIKNVKGALHAVVWKNGKVVHDPNPNKPPLGKLLYLISIDKL